MTDMINKNFTPLARAQIWEEHLKKEQRHSKLREEFTINPKKMSTIAENPLHMKRHTKWRRSYMLPGNAEKAAEAEKEWIRKFYELDESVIKGLQTSSQPPRERYEWVATSNMEYGWTPRGPWRAQDDRNRLLNKSTCDVVKFSEHYFIAKGHHVFSKLANVKGFTKTDQPKA
jgi:hypothetical protein